MGNDPRAQVLARFIAEHRDQLVGVQGRRGGRVAAAPLLGSHDPDLDTALGAVLNRVLDDEVLARWDKLDTNALAERIAERLDGEQHSRDTLWALLGGDDRVLEAEPAAPARSGRPGRAAPYGRRRAWLARQFAAAVMNLIIIATAGAAWLVFWLPASAPPRVDWPVLALKAFALWILAFLPCWLYVRFLGQRAGALWDEYVLHLHRLGWDQPRFLPRPPRTSAYYEEWVADGGRTQMQDRNIYRQKFNAYYGRSVAENAREDDYRVRLDTLFPVFLTVAVLAVCWSAVLWDDRFLRSPVDVWDVLKFGFLGAYVFVVQMLIRRFFGSDLRPSAYTSGLLRITVTLIGVAAVYQVLEIWGAVTPDIRRWEAVAAFAIGFFPLLATQVVVRAATTPLRTTAPTLESDYPLSQLDGLNIWYEARLAEENIDDMQNLATANFVDVVLHTRVPVGRLVDWVDQAFLFLHLDRVERGVRERRRAYRPQAGADSGAPAPGADLAGKSVGPGSRAGTRTRTVLRQLGIRTATDLLKAFPPEAIDPPADAPEPPATGQVREVLRDAQLEPSQIRMLVRVLSEEHGLAPVWNWYDRGVRARRARR